MLWNLGRERFFREERASGRVVSRIVQPFLQRDGRGELRPGKDFERRDRVGWEYGGTPGAIGDWKKIWLLKVEMRWG